MEIRVLNYFLTVAREQSITKAAEVLHVTQPTLSRQLMQLEEELDVQLFVRGKRKITLTQEGMLLRRRAEEITDLTNKTKREFSEANGIVAGQISIGGAETKTMQELAKIMQEFSKEYPQVTYNLYSGNADDIQERLDKGLLDIALLLEPVNIEKYDYIRLQQKEIRGLLMRKDHPLAAKPSIGPTDLKDITLLNSGRTMVQQELASWAGVPYEQLTTIAFYNLIYNATIMVEQGLGCACTLEHLVTTNDQSPLCFRPFEPKLELGAVIVWKKYQVFSPATTKFIERVKNALKA